MMTTETSASRPVRPYGVAALGLAVLGGTAAGLVVGVLAVVTGGREDLLGGVLGAGLTLFVLASGFAVVDLVAGLVPRLSVLVALLTYVLQMVALGALLVVLTSAEGVEETLSPRWFAGGVLAVAAAWTVVLLVHATRARVPLYDLPERAPAGAAEGSEVR